MLRVAPARRAVVRAPPPPRVRRTHCSGEARANDNDPRRPAEALQLPPCVGLVRVGATEVYVLGTAHTGTHARRWGPVSGLGHHSFNLRTGHLRLQGGGRRRRCATPSTRYSRMWCCWSWIRSA